MPSEKSKIAYYQDGMPLDAALLDRAAQDTFVRSQGALLVHFKATKCPIGLISATDDYRPHAAHDNCSNGHIYKKAGEVTVMFTNNSMRNSIRDIGQTEIGVVGVTLPTKYDNSNDDIFVAAYDRFYFKEDIGVVETQDTIEASRQGIDRLQFPIVSIEYIIDANGVEYSSGDYTILPNGTLKWTGAKRPSYDPALNRGTVYTCRYRIKPFFYVKSMVHEIRVATQIVNGKPVTARMPYGVILQREISFQNQLNQNDPNYNSLAQQRSPSSGGFGSR